MQAKIIRRIFPFLSNYVNVTRKKDVVDLLNHYPAPTSSGCRPLLPLDLPRRSSLRGERLQALAIAQDFSKRQRGPRHLSLLYRRKSLTIRRIRSGIIYVAIK